MWDLPRPGLEPVSPALAGRFSTTAPPGKPEKAFLLSFILWVFANKFILRKRFIDQNQFADLRVTTPP